MIVEDVRTDEENGDTYIDVEWLDSRAHLQHHTFYVEQLELYTESCSSRKKIDFGP